MGEISEPDLAQILALDELTLRNHTEQSGQEFNLIEHEKILRTSLAKSAIVIVRRHEMIVAYANLWPIQKGDWFAGMINVHPQHRNASVLRELFGSLRKTIAEKDVKSIQSNVYKANRLSVAFHKKLGFEVTQENDIGYEFTLAF